MKALSFFVLSLIGPHLLAQESPTPSPAPVQPASELQAATPTALSSTNDATAPATAPNQYRPGIGTIIVAELSNSLDVKKAKVGDRVECTVAQDLLFQGKVVIPANARVIGHVTEAEAFTRDHPQSRVGLTFEKILLKNKKELLFQEPAIVVALAPPAKAIVKTATDMRQLPVQMQNGGASPGTGSSSGASILGTIASNPDVLGANMPSSSGTISGSNRGVIAWPGLFLLKGPPGTSVIASPKANVQLDFQSQMVLRVAETGR